MIKIDFKEEKGITLVTLGLAIVIMIIISSTLLYNAQAGIKTRALNNMYNDIEILKDRVDIYYSKYGKIPVIEEAYTNTNEIARDITNMNPNDNDKYYCLDLEALENITLNYGKDYQAYKVNPYIAVNDVYIINEQSHNIYYAKGISLDGKTYYTVPGDYTKVELNARICNYPKLATGMTPVKWNGTEFVETQSYDPEWYEYIDTSISGQESNSKWANVKTKDGSMWVWIPRFAYKITYTDASDKSSGGTIDVVFLKDTTNLDFNGNDVTSSSYVDANGTKGAYIVHPAFQDGTKNGYANGEWDNEVVGFWMAKFEAGYVGTAGDASSATDSNVAYSTITYWDGTTTADLLSNYYGTRNVGTLIKYPTFQANRPSMNNIGISDAYDLCRSIQNATSVYGLSNVDSHMTKNSEWGAVAYLTHSKYGRNGAEVTINNISLDNTTNTIYAVTGYAGETTSADALTTIWSSIENGTQAGSWTTAQGQKASTTGNIYGIYDLSGGLWEWTAGYIATTGVYDEYGGSLKGESSKYKTKYAYSGTGESDTANYNESENVNRIGDAVTEVSSSGHWGSLKSWNNDRSDFPMKSGPFIERGGGWSYTSGSGVFCFGVRNGGCTFHLGFRTVLYAL